MTEEFVGACGKKLKGYCIPPIEDDLCAMCSFNIYNDDEMREELDLDEDDLEETEDEEEQNSCLDCVWWMDIADHTKEYYPDMACCAPQFDFCCTCDYQTLCKEGKLKKGCVYR